MAGVGATRLLKPGTATPGTRVWRAPGAVLDEGHSRLDPVLRNPAYAADDVVRYAAVGDIVSINFVMRDEDGKVRPG